MLCFDNHRAFIGLDGQKVFLDAPGAVSFVSHAHSDHVPSFAKSKNAFSSSPTADLIRVLKGKTVGTALPKNIELLDSGHVLGGKMLFAQADGASVLYTGDFKTADSLTLKGAQPHACDVLLLESTYGLPHHSFPDREETYRSLSDWVKKEQSKNRIVLLGGYSLGKAQDVIRLLNSYCGIAPIASGGIAAVNEVYATHGIKLDFLKAGSPEAVEALNRSFVSVLPMHHVTPQLISDLEAHYNRKVSYAACTGWNVFSNGFCLSDHCDYEDLVGFVEQCNPKKVFVNHGYSNEFAADLRKRGFDAVSIDKAGVKTLEAFC